jgi:hypothetical protein
MRLRESIIAGGVLAAFIVITGAPRAHAGNSCVGDAAGGYKNCKADCKEDFQVAKDTCLNRDHACVEACREDRRHCRDATGIDDAIAQCDATLVGARRTCRQNNPTDAGQRDHCIDQAQDVAFQCRDAAREAAKSGLKQCRKDFQACAQACPPANPPSSADPKQCKSDAQEAYQACKGGCVEAFQTAKDECRNRDHVCVEGCRADRDVCLGPKLDALVAAYAACNATRDGDVQNCKNLYGAGTPERDTCIDNAQLAAFQCRDQAREDARPGLDQCRADFQACAQGCPPIS